MPFSASYELDVFSVAICGVLSHLLIFIHGEWHMQAPKLFTIYSILAPVLFVASNNVGDGIHTHFTHTALLISSYAVGLFTSMTIYRRYFYRLRKFPGPWAAGITKLWHVWQCRHGQNFLVIEKLWQRYGPSYGLVLRNSQSLTLLSLLPSMDLGASVPKLFDHDARRRIWDRGFSTKALDAYQVRVVEYAELLASRIEVLAKEQNPVNVSDWFYWFTFDVMGEFAFARSFAMLQNEEWHFAVTLLRKAMSLLGPFSPVPWIAQIAFHITPWMYIVRDWSEMMSWCKDRMTDRIQAKIDRPDVSHWLIEASTKRGSLEADRKWLNGDAVTIIIAGSDTVAPTLVFTFYEMAHHPAYQAQLFSALKDIDIFDHKQLRTCTFLTAIIHETLQLHPPVPTGGYRQTPPSGMTINGTYIPGNVTIVSPRYSLARLQSSYESADQFVPERWTTKQEMVNDIRGFVPFSQGRFNCVGKTLAMNEMRFVIALLIKKFEVQFWGNERGQRLFSDLKDQFTAAPGRLDLKFRLRTDTVR
ncbi:hypothetical protein FHL15_005649 [Xylaria flabelliformis]|uniref:Cytochrome P450 n=1 Tax=Xylaria flabelliformis TaxID=2512241 RepID=A0A553HZJ3_9PEZI|nr:hypothetical protein FHL15_005649 [Xylaria flabelliformis]